MSTTTKWSFQHSWRPTTKQNQNDHFQAPNCSKPKMSLWFSNYSFKSTTILAYCINSHDICHTLQVLSLSYEVDDRISMHSFQKLLETKVPLKSDIYTPYKCHFLQNTGHAPWWQRQHLILASLHLIHYSFLVLYDILLTFNQELNQLFITLWLNYKFISDLNQNWKFNLKIYESPAIVLGFFFFFFLTSQWENNLSNDC